jgi:hypothetical protein
METIKLFVKEGCGLCPSAKEVGSRLTQEGLQVRCYDLDTADGLAEASYYGILSTPTMIIEDADENMLADFRGTVPTVQQIKNALTGT